MATVTCEIQWLVYLFQDLKVPFEQPSLLYCDNDSARYIAANSVFHECTKDIEIDCRIVRETSKKSLIHLLLISTPEQLADIYTKVLGPQSFKNICFKLGLINISSQFVGVSEDIDKASRRKLILCDFVFMTFMTKSNYHQFCLFVFILWHYQILIFLFILFI